MVKVVFNSLKMEMTEYFNLPDFITGLLDIAIYIVKYIVGLIKQE